MSSNLASGARLGRYEVRSQLGKGGMGEVYLAQDTKLDRKVALKILPADVATHPDRMKRFVQEAKAASALNHPNIITIYEIDDTDSDHFIATEFIDGETLRERMRTALMKLGEVLDMATQIAGALTAAHEHDFPIRAQSANHCRTLQSLVENWFTQSAQSTTVPR